MGTQMVEALGKGWFKGVVNRRGRFMRYTGKWGIQVGVQQSTRTWARGGGGGV